MIPYADIVMNKKSNAAEEASSAMGINPVVEDVTTAVTTTAATTSPIVSNANTTIVIGHEFATDTISTIPVATNSESFKITHNIGRTFKVPRPTNSESWMTVGSSPLPTKGCNLESKDPTPPHLQVRGEYTLLMKSVNDTDNYTDNSMKFQDVLHQTTSLSTLESRSRLKTFKAFSPDADVSKEMDGDNHEFRDLLEDLKQVEGTVNLNEQEIAQMVAVHGIHGALTHIVDDHVDFDLDKKCPAVASSPPSIPTFGRKKKPISLGEHDSTKKGNAKKVSMSFYLFNIIQLYKRMILTINVIRYFLDIQARHSTGDSSKLMKPTFNEYLANHVPTFELPLVQRSKRERKPTKFFAKENSNIEEARSSLIFQGINNRSIHDDMISNALDAFKGDVPQAVEALYQNFQHPNPIMSSSYLSSPTNAGKSSDDTGGSIIDSGEDLSFEDEKEDNGEYSNNEDLGEEEESDEYKGEYEENEKDGKAEDKCNELSNKVKKGTISGQVGTVLQVLMGLNQMV
jgi:hypothetical protein